MAHRMHSQGWAVLASGVLLCCFGPTTHASRWTTSLDDSFDARFVYVDRSGSDGGSGPVLQVSPGFSLDRQGGRASANIDYTLNLTVGGSDTDPEAVTHDLTARGEIEAIERLLYIDATASSRFVGNSATTGGVDAITGSNDGTQSYSIQISPSFRPESDNRYVRFVSDNNFDLVDYTGGSSSSDGSNATTFNAGLVSGPFFTTFDWDVGVTRTETSFDDRNDVRSDASAGLGYRVSPQLRLTSRLGYEDNDVDTDRSDTDGLTWDIGGDWSPSPRTSISVNYGDRYFGETYSGSFSHRSRRTTFSFDVVREVTNRRNFRFADSFFLLVDGNGDPIEDPVSGQPVIVNIPQLEETDEDFLNTEFRGAVSVVGRRTSVSVTANVGNREFEVSGEDEDTYGISLSLSRELGQGISSRLFGNFDRVEGATDGDSDFYRVGLNLDKTLSSRTSVSFELSHSERDGDVSENDFRENRIGVTVSTSFL